MPIILGPLVTPDPDTLTFDPVTENPANAELVVTSGSYGLLAHKYPTPPLAAQWASSVSTEGSALSSIRHENRQIDLTIDVTGVDALQALEAKFAKLYREGGTLKRTFPDGRVIIFDVLTADGWDPAFEQEFYAGVTQASVSLTCKPYGRGPEQTLILHTETTLPVNVFTETGIKGDMPALGRLVVTDAQVKNQWWVVWGLQSRFYDAAVTAGLFYEAEGRTLLGTSTVVTGGATASGGATNNAVRGSLTGSDQAILSTQTTGGGAHLTHVGTFRVFARVWQGTANTGTVTLGLQWSAGDFNNPSSNDDKTLDSAIRGKWLLTDLGLVTLPQVKSGAQRWEGRIIASSTVAGDTLDVDYLMLVPADEGYGEVSGIARAFTPSTFSARDEFDQAAGALATKTLPVGGAWSGAGDADDFATDGAGKLTRTAVSDVDLNTGRYAIAGTATFTDVAVAVDSDTGTGLSGANWRGVLARYTDTNNWVRAELGSPGTGTSSVFVRKRIAGTVTTVATKVVTSEMAGTTRRLLFILAADGSFSLTLNGITVLTGYDVDLATGGTLASGKTGVYDYYGGSSAVTRQLDNFWVAVPPSDAAIYASQSLEVRHDSVIREDATGTVGVRPSSYEGSYLRIPSAGAEGRTVRLLVKATRFDPFAVGDIAIDDLSAQLYYTPRYLAVPSS